MKFENENAVLTEVSTAQDVEVWVVDKRDGTRLTDCCGAYSTSMETGETNKNSFLFGIKLLCCEACYKQVQVGQGDGVDNILKV
mgnify:FL=1